MDVRRPPRIRMVAPGIGSRLDGREAIAPLRVGQHAPRTLEIGIERRVMDVDRVVIASCGVALPQLHQGPGEWLAVLVEYSARHDDPLTQRLAARDLLRQVSVSGIEHFLTE